MCIRIHLRICTHICIRICKCICMYMTRNRSWNRNRSRNRNRIQIKCRNRNRNRLQIFRFRNPAWKVSIKCLEKHQHRYFGNTVPWDTPIECLGSPVLGPWEALIIEPGRNTHTVHLETTPWAITKSSAFFPYTYILGTIKNLKYIHTTNMVIKIPLILCLVQSGYDCITRLGMANKIITIFFHLERVLKWPKVETSTFFSIKHLSWRRR